jgi:hypothetical protein
LGQDEEIEVRPNGIAHEEEVHPKIPQDLTRRGCEKT